MWSLKQRGICPFCEEVVKITPDWTEKDKQELKQSGICKNCWEHYAP